MATQQKQGKKIIKRNKSALKRARQNEKRRERNKAAKTRVRSVIKDVKQAIEDKKNQEVSALLVTAQSIIDKAAKKGIIHKKNASRKISRLSKFVKLAQAKQTNQASA